jgi:hypothetical protein
MCLQRAIAWSAWALGSRACAETMTFGQQMVAGSTPSEAAHSLTRHEETRGGPVLPGGAKVSVQTPPVTVPWSAS